MFCYTPALIFLCYIFFVFFIISNTVLLSSSKSICAQPIFYMVTPKMSLSLTCVCPHSHDPDHLKPPSTRAHPYTILSTNVLLQSSLELLPPPCILGSFFEFFLFKLHIPSPIDLTSEVHLTSSSVSVCFTISSLHSS